MLRLREALRPFWAFGINNITTNKSEIFSKWLELRKSYRIETQIQATEFEIHTNTRSDFLLPISQDCNRFGIAAFESLLKVEDPNHLPKTISWLIVKLYYAAFYAAHLILRLFGYSLSQLDRTTISSVQSIANLYGSGNGVDIEKGFYICDYSTRSSSIHFTKAIKAGEDGSHSVMWKLFNQKIAEISNLLLQQHTGADYQRISIKLADLCGNLSYMGSNNGGWLSKIRNDINYKHLHGTWFPYHESQSYYYDFSRNLDDWKSDPLDIELRNLSGRQLLRFLLTCQFIVGMAREIAVDMSSRCSEGRSFLDHGIIALLKFQQIKQ